MATRKKYKIVLSEKYVRKSENGKEWFQFPVNISGQLVAIQTIIPLDLYTEPDMEQVRKEAYDKGYDDATAEISSDEQAIAEKAYQRGINDAREGKASCEFCEYEMCSDRADPCRICACNYMNFFKPKKQEKEEYHTGDEVIRHYKSEYIEGDDAPSIFLSEEDGHFRCLAFNGRSIMIAEYPKNQYRKTGRHFPEIASVLQKMRES